MASANPFRGFLRRTPGARRRWGDLIFRGLVTAGAVVVVGLILAIVYILFNGSTLSRGLFGFGILTNPVWDIQTNVFGLLPFIEGTLLTSAIALLFAIPIALGTSIFLTQLAPKVVPGAVKAALAQIVDLLAAIPSIVYGFWGLFVLVPYMRTAVEPALRQDYDSAGNTVAPGVHSIDPSLSGWAGQHNPFAGTIIGQDLFTASIVLAIMIIPTVAAISRDALAAVPIAQREAALALGATPWEATRVAVLPYARSGIFGGTILGLGRALGETMAVTLVIGNALSPPTSLFGGASTLASLIATQFSESTGPLEYSVIIEAGLVLLLITLAINIGARAILWRFHGPAGGGVE